MSHHTDLRNTNSGGKQTHVLDYVIMHWEGLVGDS